MFLSFFVIVFELNFEGIIPRTVESLFQMTNGKTASVNIGEVTVEMSYFEIYNNRVIFAFRPNIFLLLYSLSVSLFSL